MRREGYGWQTRHLDRAQSLRLPSVTTGVMYHFKGTASQTVAVRAICDARGVTRTATGRDSHVR